MPSFRISINLAFGKDPNTVLLVFLILKTICALESYHFAYLIKKQENVDNKNMHAASDSTTN